MEITYQLHLGDCLEVLATLPDNSVDSIVTDPPYGLSFMGKKWDWLLEEAGKRSARPAYINSTPRGIYAWDLYRIKEPIWEERILPATTNFENRDQIRKVVGFLPITEAMVLS